MKRQELEKLIREELLAEKNYIQQAKDWLAKSGAAAGMAARQRRGGPGSDIVPGRGTGPDKEGSMENSLYHGEQAAKLYVRLEKEGGEPAGPYVAEIERLVKEIQEAIQLRDGELSEIGNLKIQAATAADQEKYEEYNEKYQEVLHKTLTKYNEAVNDPKWEQLVLYPLGLKKPEELEADPDEEPEELELDEKIVGWEAVTDSVKKYLGAEYNEAKVRIVLQALKRVNKNPKIKFERGPMGEPVKEDMELGDAYKMISSEAGISSEFMRAVVLAVINTSNIEVRDFKIKGMPVSSLKRRKKKEKPESKTHPKGSVAQIGPPKTSTTDFEPLFPGASAKVWEEASSPHQDPNIYRLERMMDSFYPYAKEQLGFDKDAVVIFESDPENAKLSLGKTGYYDPQTYTVTVYITDRHPKDVMRSVAHELTHHTQNCRGENLMASGAGEEGYTQSDPHLRAMEQEAYEQAEAGNGLLFRDWEDGVKAQFMEAVRQKIKDKTLIKEGPPAIRKLIKENSSILDVT